MANIPNIDDKELLDAILNYHLKLYEAAINNGSFGDLKVKYSDVVKEIIPDVKKSDINYFKAILLRDNYLKNADWGEPDKPLNITALGIEAAKNHYYLREDKPQPPTIGTQNNIGVNYGNAVQGQESRFENFPMTKPTNNPTNAPNQISKNKKPLLRTIWEYVSNNALIAGILAAIVAALVLLYFFGHF